MLVFKLHPLFDCINMDFFIVLYVQYMLIFAKPRHRLLRHSVRSTWVGSWVKHESQRFHLHRRIFYEQQDAKMMFGRGAYKRPHDFLV